MTHSVVNETGGGALGVIVEENVPVRMRDGVVLRANVFRPDATGRYPGLLLRTPYGKPAGGFHRHVRNGYAVVTQDIRGRYASDGCFVPFTVPDTGDAEDGYDSVEWLAVQPWCNGRVGTMGASYNAWLQWELARLQPPHLAAMCAYTIPLELTGVDWCGAFRAGRRIKWWLTTIAPDLRRRQGLPGPQTPAEARRLWEDVEQGHWVGYLPWKRFPDHLPPGLAEYAADWLAHPNRRPWGFDKVHAQVEVPNLDFSGWYDHCNDTIRHLAGMQAHGRTAAAREQTRLVIGPWNHAGLGQRRVGDIDFGPQAEVDLPDLIMRWFDYWLKDIPNGQEREPAVRYFVMGSGRWKSTATWPPGNTVERVWLLGSAGNAGSPGGDGWLREAGAAETAGTDTVEVAPVEANTVEAETNQAASAVHRSDGAAPKRQGWAGAPDRQDSAPHCDADSYCYDPRDPVPTLWGPEWFTAPADRRQLAHRRDILYYRSAPLTEAVEATGYPEAVVYVSTTAPDTDFFARLVDEHPPAGAVDGDLVQAPASRSGPSTQPSSRAGGPALEICYGMVRLRHRRSLDHEELVQPGQVVELRLRLGATACRFQSGHRIRLEITSSDFPNHDRNHNTGGDDLAEMDMAVATQTVYHDPAQPSRLVLPVDAGA